MGTKLRPYQQKILAGIGILAIVVGVYAFFAMEAILSLSCWGIAIILMWYLVSHGTNNDWTK